MTQTVFFVKLCNLIILIHSGAVGSTYALQQDSPDCESQLGVFLHGFYLFSQCMCRSSPGTTDSSDCQKT